MPDFDFDFASSPRAYGCPGAGGSFCFADPDARLGVAYLMNQMGHYLRDDPREKALRDATYSSHFEARTRDLERGAVSIATSRLSYPGGSGS